MGTNFLNDGVFRCWCGQKLLLKQQCQVGFEDFFIKSLMERDNGGSAFVVLVTITLELGVGLNLMSLVVLVGVDGVSFVSLVNEFISNWFRNSFAIFYKQSISMTILGRKQCGIFCFARFCGPKAMFTFYCVNVM